jgi:hypothetical protein
LTGRSNSGRRFTQIHADRAASLKDRRGSASSIGHFFIDTGLTLNANNSIVITDTTLAGIYLAEFEEMWAGSLHEDKADSTLHLLD